MTALAAVARPPPQALAPVNDNQPHINSPKEDDMNTNPITDDERRRIREVVDNDKMTADDAKRLEVLYSEAADAKRAPELAVWILVLGPVTLDELVTLRRDRLGCSTDYAQMSVMYDLGRISGLGGPVEYGGGLFYFNDEHKRAVLEWAYDSSVSETIARLGRFVPAGGEE